MEIKTRKGIEHFAQDEHPRPQTTIESLAKLAPVFKKDGVVTAGYGLIKKTMYLQLRHSQLV